MEHEKQLIYCLHSNSLLSNSVSFHVIVAVNPLENCHGPGPISVNQEIVEL